MRYGIGVLFLIICCGNAMAQDQGVKRYGVVFNIAEDRKVEQIGGIREPEGLDKYMKRRFDELMAAIDALNQRLDKLESLLQEKS